LKINKFGLKMKKIISKELRLENINKLISLYKVSKHFSYKFIFSN